MRTPTPGKMPSAIRSIAPAAPASVYEIARRQQLQRRWMPPLTTRISVDFKAFFGDLLQWLSAQSKALGPEGAALLAQLKAWWLERLLAIIRRPSPAAWVLAAGLTAGLVSQPLPALAQPPQPLGSEFRVNTTTTGNQTSPDVAADGEGNFVVVWTSLQDGSADIYAQLYQADGTALGSEFRANSYTTASQRYPAVARDSDGDFVIAWESYGQDGSGWGIYARRYSLNGAPQGIEFPVNSYTTFSQHYPDVGMNADGDFVIAWQSEGQDGSAYGVYAQRYQADGTPLGSEFRANTYTTSSQLLPSVGLAAGGDFVITWDSYNQDGSENGIYAQRYDAAGTPRGIEFQVNTTTTGAQSNPTVAAESDGDFVITWTSAGQDGSDLGVYARRYLASGTAPDFEFLVNTTTTGQQSGFTVAVDSEGNAVIIWTSLDQDGSLRGVYGQRYQPDGARLGDEFPANSYTTGNQQFAKVAMDSDGDFVVAWESYDQDGQYGGIYAQRFQRPIEQVFLPVVLKE